MYHSTPIDYRWMEYHYMEYDSHIAQCTYTSGRCIPLQLTIGVWNTATLIKFHM